MGQGGGKETPVLPLLPVQLILPSNFPCPQQRDARRGAESGAREDTHHLPTAYVYRWIFQILKIVASVQLYFLLQDRDICL